MKFLNRLQYNYYFNGKKYSRTTLSTMVGSDAFYKHIKDFEHHPTRYTNIVKTSYGYDYTFMTEDFDMYYSRDFIQTMAAPGESMQFYMVTEENTRKNLLCPFKKTGIKITVTNIGERTDTLFLGRITKIVINERENSDEHVLMLDGIETQNLDRNTAVEELQQTGVKFKEEEVQKFVNGKIDRLVSDSANYRYIIKASQDDKQVILEVESLE